MNSETNTNAPAPGENLDKALAEPYAFAVVTWPAVIGLLATPTWPDWAHIAIALWLAAMHLAAYKRGAGFGNVMLFTSALIALAVYGHPSPWTLAILPALLIGLHAAQRARVKGVWEEAAGLGGNDVEAE